MNEYALLLRSALRSRAVNLLGRRSPFFRAPRRILVIKLDHLGDVLLATPALRHLHVSHPSAPVDIVVASASRPLLEGSPLVDRVYTYDAPRFRRSNVGATALTGANEVARARADLLGALGGHRYDWIVELRGDEWTAGGLVHRIRPARRLDRGSVRIADWARGRGGRRSARGPGVTHEIDTNLRVVAGESWTTARAETEPPVFPGASEALRDAVRRLAPTLDVGAPYVVLHLGASWAPRAWSADRFGAVAARLRAAYHASIVVLGTADDASLESAFVSGGGPSDASFFFGTLSLPEVGELLRRARLFVGSDGGLAHLAGAYGTPTLALFGPQNPARFGPRGRRVIILHHPVACYPCAQTICVRPEHPCVNLVSVEEASAAAATLWSAAP